MRKTTWKVTYYNKPMFIHPQNQLKSPKWKNRTGGKDMARRKKKKTLVGLLSTLCLPPYSELLWGSGELEEKKRKLL